MSRRAAVQGNTVHKRQLFHWIGSHIEDDDSLDVSGRRREYLNCLRGSLRDGLWLTRSQQELEADHGGETPKGVKPMVCFTDNRLSDCGYHAANYGKLGLGFPKSFVIDRFGTPVNYVSHKTRRNIYFKYFYDVHRYLESNGAGVEILGKLEYLMAFLKPISERRKRPSRPRKPRAPRPRSEEKRPPQIRLRNYGPRLTYLIESEWRIVANREVIRRLSLKPHPGFEEETFETYLMPYDASKHLFSVVFPDRITLQMAFADPELRRHLIDSLHTNTYVLDEVSEL